MTILIPSDKGCIEVEVTITHPDRDISFSKLGDIYERLEKQDLVLANLYPAVSPEYIDMLKELGYEEIYSTPKISIKTNK